MCQFTPTNDKSYESLFDKYLIATKMVCKEQQKNYWKILEDQDGHQDVMVSVDGTWQRRGRSSHNGVVTAISVVSGKALDIEILSNSYCKGCAQWKKKTKSCQHTKNGCNHINAI